MSEKRSSNRKDFKETQSLGTLSAKSSDSGKPLAAPVESRKPAENSEYNKIKETFCKIRLDNYKDEKYSPGSEILGHIIVFFHKNSRLGFVEMEYNCEERTSWQIEEEYRDRRGNLRYRYITYSASNNIYHRTQKLVAKCPDRKGFEVAMGIQTYPFKFRVPTGFPSTFSCSNGGVTYTIKAYVYRPEYKDLEDTVQLNVVAPVDLNKYSDALRDEEVLEDERNYGGFCCCGGNGPVNLTVTLPKQGYILGEAISFKLDVTNACNVPVYKIMAVLSMFVTCTVTYPNYETRQMEYVLEKLQIPGVKPYHNRSQVYDLVVPKNCEICNFQLCKLFDSAYRIKITGCVGGVCSSDLNVECWMQLGNIPLKS